MAPKAPKAPPRLAVFVFRRDLRLSDNIALAAAAEHADAIVPVFIMPDEQILLGSNPYFSHAAVQFMCESLQSLHRQIVDAQTPGTPGTTTKTSGRAGGLLVLRARNNEDAVLHLLRAVGRVSEGSPVAVYSNSDDTEYAVRRDREVRRACDEGGAEFHNVPGDYGLLDMAAVWAEPGSCEKVLASLFKKVIDRRPGFTPAPPCPSHVDRRVLKKIAAGHAALSLPQLKDSLGGGVHAVDVDSDLAALYIPVEQPIERGGRRCGLAALARMRAMSKTYADTRDLPALEAESTTRASPHLKFGTISIREAFAAAASEALARELVFREFYRRIYLPRPDLHMLRAAYNAAMDARIPWRQPTDAPAMWRAWTEGRTGIPLVDAGMRQLLRTGWAHNRVRMVVASVATRHMQFDWRACAAFYYSKLVDADASSNAAGWQWAAGIGVDAAPFFRPPFNPYRQSKRFDPDARYIKAYVPELSPVAPGDIHRWAEVAVRQRYPNRYRDPIISIQETSAASTGIWKRSAKPGLVGEAWT